MTYEEYIEEFESGRSTDWMDRMSRSELTDLVDEIFLASLNPENDKTVMEICQSYMETAALSLEAEDKQCAADAYIESRVDDALLKRAESDLIKMKQDPFFNKEIA